MESREREERKRVRYDFERGQILHELREWYPDGINPGLLLSQLDRRRVSLLARHLPFHLHYLQEKGFIDLEVAPKQIGEEEKIVLIKINMHGLDILDGRAKGDNGVILA